MPGLKVNFGPPSSSVSYYISRTQSRARLILRAQGSDLFGMLLVKQHIERDGSGYVTLRPQEDEDMWHAYNLIQEVSSEKRQVCTYYCFAHWCQLPWNTQGDELRGSAVR